MYVLRLFNINSICLATRTPKRSGIQKKKNELNGYHLRIFDALLTNMSLKRALYHDFYCTFRIAALGTTTKNLTTSVISRESP